MKNFFTLIRLFVLLCGVCYAGVSGAQCGAYPGTSQCQLNWDNLDFLPSASSTSATYYSAFYVGSITPYNQNFSMGPRRVNITTSNSAQTILNGENNNHLADAGHDVQIDVNPGFSSVITLTFDIEVRNVRFSIYDIDRRQAVSINSKNAANVDVTTTIVKRNAAGPLTLSPLVPLGSGTNPSATAGTGTGSLYDNTTPAQYNEGTIDVTVVGPVRTIAITVSTAAGTGTHSPEVYLGDINACVTGSYPNNWRAISRPFTGMPAYILAIKDSTFYMLDPATGRTKLFYQDPGNEFINGMAYDPVNRILYYTYTQTGTATRTIYKYDINSETKSTWVADVNQPPLNIPSYDNGVESGAGSFYDGYYYFGVEGTKTSGAGANMTGRENTIWKIELDGSQNPLRASQMYATRVDSAVSGNNFIHDWSDIAVTNNGIMYDFDGAPPRGGNALSNYYHFNMMTGERIGWLGPNASTGILVPRQIAVDWQENVYNVGNIGNSPSDGFVVPYLYNGTVNTPLNQTITLNGTNLFGNYGDCSEAFRPYCDFGDAPASYDPDPLAPAVNERDTALRIGATFDREWIKISSTATADGADEDGILTVPFLAPGNMGYNARVRVYNNTGNTARLIAWLDYNGNGVFNASEAIPAITVPSSTALQQFTLYWPTTTNSFVSGQATYLRVRLTYTSSGMTSANATGYYDNGETEDYRVLVDNFPLSVNLLGFTAKVVSDKEVKLDWTTTGENNFNGFNIERSTDNSNWTSIGMVYATGNGSRDVNTYTFSDNRPVKGKSYYRLRMVDYNERSRNSDIRSVTITDDIQEISIYPNPAKDKAIMSVNSSINTTATVNVSDMSGRIVYWQTIQIRKGINNIDLPVGDKVESGNYVVRLSVNDKIFTEKLVISK